MKTIVCGHRNPDVDSVASAFALAELKRALGNAGVEAVCPGLMPGKAVRLFEKAGVPPPRRVNDVFPRVRDVMTKDYSTVFASKTLFEAVRALRASKQNTIPVVEKDNTYIGMLSPVTLITDLLNITGESRTSLTGRSVYSSTKKIAKLLNAEFLSGKINSELKNYDIFVAAMSPDFFEKHLKSAKAENPVIIVGDRPEIHLRALRGGIRLIIITGSCPVEDIVLETARNRNVDILRTPFDSASAIRMLKLSTPARNIRLASDTAPLSPDDILHDIKHRIAASTCDLLPVCSADGKLAGVITKAALSSPPAYNVILVDHNELSQSVPGVEELSVAEVVDHHRIGIGNTPEPIKYTCDTVGSTCTIVASMYRAAGIVPSKSVATLILGGIITDTLFFQSPTTTTADINAAKEMESISGENGEALMLEMSRIDSPLTTMSPKDAINSDRKDYFENGWKFSLSQIEENHLAVLHRMQDRIRSELDASVKADGLDFFGLMVTDAVRACSEFIMSGSPQLFAALPYKKNADGIMRMPGVLSRKKQLLPQILGILQDLPHPRGIRG